MSLFKQKLERYRIKERAEAKLAEEKLKGAKVAIQLIASDLDEIKTVTLKGDYGQPVVRTLFVFDRRIELKLGSDISPQLLNIAVCDDDTIEVYITGSSTRLYKDYSLREAENVFIDKLLPHIHKSFVPEGDNGNG